MNMTEISLRVCESCREPMVSIEDTGQAGAAGGSVRGLEYVCYTCLDEIQELAPATPPDGDRPPRDREE